MQGDDLGVFGILWGTAIAFALAAVTMVDSGRKRILIGLWACAAAFLVMAVAWPWISEKWPEAKALGQLVSSNHLAIDAVGLIIFGLLGWDFAARRKWLARGNGGSYAQLLESKIEQVKGRLSAVEQTGGTTRDILLLMHFVVYQSTVLMLDDLLNQKPEGISIHVPLQLGGDFSIQNAAAKEFLELIRRKMDPGSMRRSNFENVMHTAEHEAEHSLEMTPMNERPAGIDPLVLRRWAIAHRQCARAIAFLQHEKARAEEDLRNQRHNLLERYREQNKS
jgi:hypothetical protein